MANQLDQPPAGGAAASAAAAAAAGAADAAATAIGPMYWNCGGNENTIIVFVIVMFSSS